MDPGNEKTGWVSYRVAPDLPGGLDILESGVTANFQIREMLRSIPRKKRGLLSIETPKPTGQLASSELFETCIMIGRFLQVWAVSRWSYIHRDDVKFHLTNDARAKDKNVTQALKDRFGGERHAVGGIRCKTCGGKGWHGRGWVDCPHCKKGCAKCKKKGQIFTRLLCGECEGDKWEVPPGPLYGIKSHAWQALAVSCYHVDQPRLIQAIMLKPDRKALTKKLAEGQPLTQALRRQFGYAGKNRKKKKRGSKKNGS